MEHVEDDVGNVEMVRIEEKFKHLPPHAFDACGPHRQRHHKGDHSSNIRYVSAAPLKQLQYLIVETIVQEYLRPWTCMHVYYIVVVLIMKEHIIIIKFVLLGFTCSFLVIVSITLLSY